MAVPHAPEPRMRMRLILLEIRRRECAGYLRDKQVSRPGRRVYVGQTDIPRVLGGLGINILTTARGVMTGRDAHKERLGGEILCRVW